MAYMGGRYLDEMNAIAFNYEFSMVPRYHYTHRHPLAIRHGRAFVEGELRLNYVHPMYIQLYLLLASGALTADDVEARIAALYSREMGEGVPILGQSIGDERTALAIAQEQSAASRSEFDAVMAGDSGASVLDAQAYARNSAEFRDLAAEIAAGRETTAADALSRRDVDTALYWGTGDPASPDPASKGQRSLDGYGAVDIVLNIGQGEARSTRVIKGCKFSGPQLITQADANPIAEVYRFVGQSFA